MSLLSFVRSSLEVRQSGDEMLQPPFCAVAMIFTVSRLLASSSTIKLHVRSSF